MPSLGIALKDFFDLSAPAPARLAAPEYTKEIASLKNTLAKRAPLVTWPVALEEILKKTEDLLDITVLEIAGAAWGKYQVLRRYADTKNYPPDETAVVPLATHTIRSIHQPYVEILVGDQPVGKVHFEIDLEVTLEGVLLSIRGGKIVEMRVGSCQAKGSVSCEGAVVAEEETKSWLLPGTIPLGDGISIAPSEFDERPSDIQPPSPAGSTHRRGGAGPHDQDDT